MTPDTLAMKNAAQAAYKMERARRRRQQIETLRLVFKAPSTKLGGVLFGIIVILSILAPLIAPYGSNEMDYSSIYAKPSAAHWFGADQFGRDVLTRLLYGARFSLALGLTAAFVGNFVGVIIGSIAGYFGGTVEMLIMRLCDVWQSLPGMLLTILLAAVLGPGFGNTVLALSVGAIPLSIRIIRGQILAERKKEYMEAAESINCSRTTIMFSHLLPNVISPIMVSATMAIGRMIMQAAGLTYLGLGIQPPTPEWGVMLAEGSAVIRTYPHLVIFPGVTIGLCVLAINLMGDGVRDALDPKLRE